MGFCKNGHFLNAHNSLADDKENICQACLRKPKTKTPTLAEKIIETCKESYMMKRRLEVEKIAFEETPRAYLTAIKKSTINGYIYCGGFIIGEFYAHSYALVSRQATEVGKGIKIQNHMIFSPKIHKSASYYIKELTASYGPVISETRKEISSGKLLTANLHPLSECILMPSDFGIDAKQIDKYLEELTK